MKALEIKELMCEINESALSMDGFDDAIVGIVERACSPPILLYDWQKCIDILQSDGIEFCDAEEYLSFNCLNAWMGENTPAFTNIYSENSA